MTALPPRFLSPKSVGTHIQTHTELWYPLLTQLLSAVTGQQREALSNEEQKQAETGILASQ